MLWLKSLHIIFMVTWFAGLFYLPRLFVYHAQAEDEVGIQRLKIMERRLFWGIMTPGAVLTAVFGISMLAINWDFYMQQSWMQLKLGFVALLIGYHVWCGLLVRHFKHGTNKHGHIWYRWFNEMPTIALVAIVLLAVIKQP